MKRIIYSIYIDIATDKLDAQPPHHGEKEDKNQKAKREFAENVDWLIARQKEYADLINAEYKLYGNDDDYKKYQAWFNTHHPYITEYNIINFYKIHLMYQLKDSYDEILYLDLDVLPATTEDFFIAHDLSKGVAIKKNNHGMSMNKDSIAHREKTFSKQGMLSSVRSPWAKWWNSKALCMEYGEPVEDIPVYNTGIVGINKHWLDKINYFEDFEEILADMKELKEEEDSMWPNFVQAMFGWDNETIWGVKCHLNKIPSVWLDGRWHTFLDKGVTIPSKSKFVHIINKNFSAVREWYETRNL